MNLCELFTCLAVVTLAASSAVAEDTPAVAPVPNRGPIYYGRPNNGGYPYTTEPPASNNGPIYYGRPNNGGYPYTTAPPKIDQPTSGSKPSINATETPAPGGYVYNGRPNNGGYPYTTAPKPAEN